MVYLLIIVLVSVYLVLRVLSAKQVMEVSVAFAGSPNGTPVIRQLSMPKNNPVFRNGDRKVDVADYKCYVVDGSSLEPLGIRDGSLLYVDEKVKGKVANDLIGHFIVLKIDNDRTRKEHPEMLVCVEDGCKVRRVIAVFPTQMNEMVVRKELGLLLERDRELELDEKGRADFLERIVRKYLFASSYYEKESELIVSITYKKGKSKDYSFHSLSFLKGIVKYKSLREV